jgi:hypothetical protein
VLTGETAVAETQKNISAIGDRMEPSESRSCVTYFHNYKPPTLIVNGFMENRLL